MRKRQIPALWSVGWQQFSLCLCLFLFLFLPPSFRLSLFSPPPTPARLPRFVPCLEGMGLQLPGDSVEGNSGAAYLT